MTQEKKQEEVTLNVTAMLDMAFQLLAFFVFTFKPPPLERQIRLKLPPVKQILGTGGQSAGAKEIDPKDIKPVKSLLVNLMDFDEDTDKPHDGVLRTVSIGVSGTPMKHVLTKDLESELRDYVQQQGYEQLVLNVSPTLNWDEVMKVVDYCAKLPTKDGKLPEFNFAPIGERHEDAAVSGS